MTVTPKTNATNVKAEFGTDSTEKFFSTASLTLFIQDAAEYVQGRGYSDERAERYYCCYLIAKKMGVQYVTSENGVSFSGVDAQGYLDLYNDRIKETNGLTLQKANSILDDETSLNPDGT